MALPRRSRWPMRWQRLDGGGELVEVFVGVLGPLCGEHTVAQAAEEHHHLHRHPGVAEAETGLDEREVGEHVTVEDVVKQHHVVQRRRPGKATAD